jgi:4-alpha-glucanotransferase
VSRLFWNELYLDVERAPALERASKTRALLDAPGYRAEAERLRAQPGVDHRAAYAHRKAALASLVREVAPVDAPLPTELAEYAASCAHAEDYAAFRAIGEREARSWHVWPAHLRAGSVGERDYEEGAYRFHLYAQWAMDRQLEAQARGSAGERATLYMDLPLGTHPDGFDVWRWRDLFADASAGAPPDAFFAGGQDWGFPPVHPRRARADGHRYWASSLRHLMRVSGMLRLDHVMSLHRLFWIPRGFSGTEGVYVRYPADELYAVLCLESHRHRTEVVGEDLGTVPAGVREDMEAHRIRRMYVVPFELDPKRGALAPEPPGAVASVNTHDMPPFASYVRSPGTAEPLGKAVGAGARPEPHALLRDTLERLAEGPARLVLVSLEDLWLETESQNRPGTASAQNWGRKAAHPLEDMAGLEQVEDTLAAVDRARARSAQAPSAPERPTRTKAAGPR